MIIIYYMEMLDNANCVWLDFYHLPSYTEREKNHMNIAFCLLLPTAGIEPGPSALQANALSITLSQVQLCLVGLVFLEMIPS